MIYRKSEFAFIIVPPPYSYLFLPLKKIPSFHIKAILPYSVKPGIIPPYLAMGLLCAITLLQASHSQIEKPASLSARKADQILRCRFAGEFEKK
jgi:hypothetical protein